LPNYSTAANEPAGDAGFVYTAASGGTGGAGTGVAGGLSYTFDFYNSGGTFTTRTTAQGLNLRFLVYDVDGEPSQGEAVRIAKGNGTSGFISYQRGNGGTSVAGNTVGPLIVTEDLNNYTFTGQNDNIAETNSAAATVFNFQNTNSVTFNFEALTRAGSATDNPVFSAIDGDLSILGATETLKQVSLLTNFGPVVTANAAGTTTPVPEPFTIIGTLVGGTAALRMRKKLKASSGV
ncbi:PEP-CTERM sorting domain-containing protein, partial [Chamaesiphon sp. OTE_8_metabat_110]